MSNEEKLRQVKNKIVELMKDKGLIGEYTMFIVPNKMTLKEFLEKR